jgi:hypothetical protein
LRLQEKFNIKWLCTDDYDAYKKIQITESEASLIKLKIDQNEAKTHNNKGGNEFSGGE